MIKISSNKYNNKKMNRSIYFTSYFIVNSKSQACFVVITIDNFAENGDSDWMV